MLNLGLELITLIVVNSPAARGTSQNHRMAVVQRVLWRSSGPTLLLIQGHPEPVAQDHVQMAFEYLQA